MTRRIAKAQRLRETLHYKSERSMTFQTFLDCMEHMFNMYEKEGKPFTEQAKVCELSRNQKERRLS